MIGKYIASKLASCTALVAIVGTQIYPLKGDKDATLPAVTYRTSLDESNEPYGMAEQNDFQIFVNAYSVNYGELNEMVKSVNDWFKAVDNELFEATTLVEAIYYIDDEDGFDEDAKAFSKQLEFKVLTSKNL